MILDWKIQIDDKGIEKQIENLVNEDVMLQIHNLFAKMCNDYVPMDEGPLSQHIEVTPEYVRYAEPYAHYQYMGEVKFGYNREKHPKAAHHWDKVMMQEKGNIFLEGVKAILRRRARELYG